MTFSTMYKPGGLRAWVSIHLHHWVDLHLQLRLRNATAGFREGGYLDISLLFVTFSFGYWRLV